MSLLNIGDTVGFIAPSAGLENNDIQPSLEYFEKELGLKVKLAPNLSSSYRYMAGTDSERATTVMNMYMDKDIKALFTIKGCAGSSRILNHLDFSTIAQNPKPIFGLSDATCLQNAIIGQTPNSAYTGFLPLYNIKKLPINPDMNKNLKDILFADTHQIISGKSLINGKTEGKIIGGCLTPLMYLSGTSYMPDLANKILLLEDVKEKTYKIDLVFNQLKQHPHFDKLKGIIFGQFLNCIVVDDFDGDINVCINDFIKDLTIPVITDFQYGHIQDSQIIPLGIDVTLSASADSCSISW